MNIEEVKSLKERIDSTNQRLIYANAQVETSKQRQSEILKEYGCLTFEEFQALLKKKEAEMQTLMVAANQYLEKVEPIIQQVESVMTNANHN